MLCRRSIRKVNHTLPLGPLEVCYSYAHADNNGKLYTMLQNYTFPLVPNHTSKSNLNTVLGSPAPQPLVFSTGQIAE